MSSIPHNVENGNEISNSVTNFMKEFQIGLKDGNSPGEKQQKL